MIWRLSPAVILVFLSTSAAVVSGCGRSRSVPEAVEAWFDCEECEDGQRARVRALGERAVPALERMLLDGPSRRQRRLVRRKFESIEAVARTGGVGSKQEIDELVQAFVANRQKRAALSLGDIGGDRARDALRRALQPRSVRSYRSDVVAVIRIALASLDPARFRGDIAPSVPGFGDTVILRPPANETFASDAVAGLRDSPYSAAEVRQFVESGRLGFAAVGVRGPHVVTVQNGVTNTPQSAQLLVRTLLDPTDRRMAFCPTLQCKIDSAPRLLPTAASLMARPAGLLAFLSLWRTASSSDTEDLFRFDASAPFRITARVDWRQNANVDLQWVRCSDGVPVGDSSGISGANPERTSVEIPGAGCWVLLVKLASADTASGVIARLLLTSP
jgi:hypothetical protein